MSPKDPSSFVFLGGLFLLSTSLSACNSASQGDAGTQANPAQVQSQGQSQGQGGTPSPSKFHMEFKPEEAELAKLCRSLEGKDLIASDGSFKVQVGHSEETTGSGPFQIKTTKGATLEGSCAPGQVSFSLSISDSHDGPFASSGQKVATHHFSTENDTSTPLSRDQNEEYFPIETNGPTSGSTNTNDKISAEASHLAVETSGAAVTLHYELHGGKEHGDNGSPIVAFDSAVEAQFAIPSAGGKPGAVTLSFKPIGSDTTNEEEFNISIQSN